MKLELSKQYPFNFVALAFALLGRKLDNHALAKFDACEVDAFLQERSYAEKATIAQALSDDGATPPSECQVKTLHVVARSFERRYLEGHFSLVSLDDFNGLAVSWAAVEKLVDKIDRLRDDFAAKHCLYEVRDILAMQVSNAKSYGKMDSIYDDASELLVRNFAMDSYGRQLLIENNLDTVSKLTCVTADYLLSIREFGEKRLARVRECLKEHDAHLLGEG